MRYLIIPIAILLAATAAGADQDGGRAGGFLDLGGSASEIALGGDLCAVADETGALLRHPAGLSGLSERRAALTHALLEEDRSRNVLAYVHPVGRFHLGAGWLHASTDGIQSRGTAGELLGEFDDAESAFILGAATRVRSDARLDLDAGAAIRYLRHTLQDNTGTGAGLDLGVSARLRNVPRLRDLVIAASLQNLGADIGWDTATDRTDPVPTTLRAGVAARLAPMDLLLTAALSHAEDLDTRLHLGIEAPIQDLALRLGLDDGDVCAGFGLPVQAGRYRFQLGYGYRGDEISDAPLHVFSIAFLH